MKLVFSKTNHRGHGEEIYLQGVAKMLIPPQSNFFREKENASSCSDSSTPLPKRCKKSIKSVTP
jgi:hypothetical protein